ncbi:MAG TPA: glucoamylase family protein [Terriglobales bacterium]|nr:glucoamylase family protein [Terriglobales bacterium]
MARIRERKAVRSWLILLAVLAACEPSEPLPAPRPELHEAELFCPEQWIENAEQIPACIAADIFEDAPRAAVIPRAKKQWEAELGGENAARPHIKARLAGWPSQLLADPAALPHEPRPFLRRVAADTWRGLQALVDRDHGLPIDNVHFANQSVGDADFRLGDYASSTNLGLYLMAIVAARELEFLAPEDALQRARLLIDTVRQLETYNGFLFNYYDTTSLERTSNFVSFIDSAWFTAGLMVARQALPPLRPVIDELIGQIDYRFFYDEGVRRMSHGYDVGLQSRSRYHYGVFYTEARLASLIAIGKGDVPALHWGAMDRHMPAACGTTAAWPDCAAGSAVLASQRPYSEWRGIRYIPSWGGSMFEALMPVLVIDEPKHSPAALGANGAAHAQIQRLYATGELRYPVWGMSPSINPATGQYGEFGVALLGSRGYNESVVTPHAAALALAVAPEEATENLRQLATRYRIYGEYGFYDAVRPENGQVSHSYLTLDQAMILIAIANHLADHAIQRYFEADPIAAAALPLVREEHLFD